jgi:hypothetical protein
VSTSSQSGFRQVTASSLRSLSYLEHRCRCGQASDRCKGSKSRRMHIGQCECDHCAATATEAFVNELSHMLSTLDTFGRHAPPTTPVDWKGIGELLEQLEDTHAQVTAKYLLASILLPKDALRKGDQPYQDFDMLINVRNDFAHPKAQAVRRNTSTRLSIGGGHTTPRLTR